MLDFWGVPLSPLPETVVNEGWTVGIPEPKNGSCQPCGDSNPGRGGQPKVYQKLVANLRILLQQISRILDPHHKVLEVSHDRCHLQALPWIWEDYSEAGEVLNRNPNWWPQHGIQFSKGGWVVVVNVVVKGCISVLGGCDFTGNQWFLENSHVFSSFNTLWIHKFCWLESPHIHIQDEDLYYTPSKDHKRSILSC